MDVTVCVRSRTAGNMYLPTKRGEWQAFLISVVFFDRLVWGRCRVKMGLSDGDLKTYLRPVINSAECIIFPSVWFSVLTLQLSISQLFPHTAVADSAKGNSSEGLWQHLSLNQTCQPHIPRPMWLLKINCHLASAQGSILLQIDSWKSSDSWLCDLHCVTCRLTVSDLFIFKKSYGKWWDFYTSFFTSSGSFITLVFSSVYPAME